jgi:hypothetical protein
MLAKTSNLRSSPLSSKPPVSTTAKALVQRYSERILENESLGSNLTDAQYKPILDRAMARLQAAGKLATGPGAEAKMGAAYQQVLKQLKTEVKTTEKAADEMKQRFQERFLDNEALCENLTDDKASPIIKFACAEVDKAVDQIADPSSAAGKLQMEQAWARIARAVRAQVVAAGG